MILVSGCLRKCGRDLPKFAQQADELRDTLKQYNFFVSLPDGEQKKLLKGEQAFYLNREALEQRMGTGRSDLKAVYRLLSIQAHTLPMSFYRTIEQRRGTGVETETEIHYICMAGIPKIPLFLVILSLRNNRSF
ncbi:hypothetical protein [Mucilaginibacter glaciei]|uniref:Uncharacterized protein n=1 Tax=Mucilaginibacter glaciei TaxID=2772109 RepID=A0A926NUU1_9SPHI|nr:hypothetical protein [Mucilaginibacter glaciei]MBD1395120.1 hypothetical protein [Mucilaginibacter glaciei]